MEYADFNPVPPETPFPNALTCQVCGSHDPSVRQVIYPYVISLIAITYRREYHGRWCWKHRFLYFLRAFLLTITLGWFGIPFGLVNTPIALYRLITGKVMHKASNHKLLRSLWEENMARGFLDDARRCLENSFHFINDIWGRQQLADLYRRLEYSGQTRSGFASSSAGPLLLFAAAMGLSGLAGLLTFLAEDRVYNNLDSGNIILWQAVLWLPVGLLATLAILSLRQLLERVLENHPYRHPGLVLGLALVTGLTAAYGFFQGWELGYFFILLNRHIYFFPSGTGLIHTLAAVFMRGGLLVLPQELSNIDEWNTLHHIFLAIIPLFFPAVMLLAAWPYLKLQKILAEVRRTILPDEPMPVRLFPELAPLFVLAALGVGMFFIPQQATVDFIEARDHYYQGFNAMDVEDTEMARAEFKTAVMLDDRFPAAHVELGWVNYLLDDNAQAIVEYSRAIELDPEDAFSHYDLGRIYSSDGQTAKAVSELERSIQLDPENDGAYLELGWIAYESGELEKSEQYFLQTLKYNEEEYDAYIGLGYIYEDLGQMDEMIASYQKAAEAEDAPPHTHLLLGIAYYDKNELELAQPVLEKVIRMDEENFLARDYLNDVYIYTGQPDLAVELSRQTLELFPEAAGSHAMLAISLLETRQVDEARAEIAAARAVSEKSDQERALILRALMNLDLAEEAEAEALEAIQESEHPAEFELILADAYSAGEKFDLALKTCRQAGEDGAREEDAAYCEGNVHIDREEFTQAAADLKRAVELDPEDAGSRLMLSMAYAGLEDVGPALEENLTSVKLDRYNANACLHLAALQLTSGKVQEAIASAARAAELSPYSENPHFFLGMAYLEAGMDSRAEIELNKFLDMYEEWSSDEGLKKDAEEALKGFNQST